MYNPKKPYTLNPKPLILGKPQITLKIKRRSAERSILKVLQTTALHAPACTKSYEPCSKLLKGSSIGDYIGDHYRGY